VKLLLIFFVLACCAALIYVRLRPYIIIARRFFDALRTARRLNDPPPRTATRPPAQAEERLVNCAACGTWLPASRALVFRATKTTYCSPDCVERAAGTRA
jgi:hypothetical protein